MKKLFLATKMVFPNQLPINLFYHMDFMTLDSIIPKPILFPFFNK